MAKKNKLYKLYIDNEDKVPVAVSDDKWLLGLFVVQRSLNKRNYNISHKKDDGDYTWDDRYLLYYFGYAISNYEYRYILNMMGEYQSDLELRIYELESSYDMHKSKMTRKERKAYKSAVKKLKKIDYGNNKKFATQMIDTIIHRRGMIVDYMENMEAFRQFMEG